MEAVALTFAGISALKDAIDLWNKNRNIGDLSIFSDLRTSDNASGKSYTRLGHGAAQDIFAYDKIFDATGLLDVFTTRVDRCNEKLRSVLVKDLNDDVIDRAINEYNSVSARN